MAKYLCPWSLLEQIMCWSGWEFPLLRAGYGSYDLAQWELRMPRKIRLLGRENS